MRFVSAIRVAGRASERCPKGVRAESKVSTLGLEFGRLQKVTSGNSCRNGA
jgi:hypothetical protein